jgi:hypothetical protein
MHPGEAQPSHLIAMKTATTLVAMKIACAALLAGSLASCGSPAVARPGEPAATLVAGKEAAAGLPANFKPVGLIGVNGQRPYGLLVGASKVEIPAGLVTVRAQTLAPQVRREYPAATVQFTAAESRVYRLVYDSAREGFQGFKVLDESGQELAGTALGLMIRGASRGQRPRMIGRGGFRGMGGRGGH